MFAKLIITCQSRDFGRSARRLNISKPHKKLKKNGGNIKFIMLKQRTCSLKSELFKLKMFLFLLANKLFRWFTVL